MAVPKDEPEIAGYKERRVAEHLRSEAFHEMVVSETVAAPTEP